MTTILTQTLVMLKGRMALRGYLVLVLNELEIKYWSFTTDSLSSYNIFHASPLRNKKPEAQRG